METLKVTRISRQGRLPQLPAYQTDGAAAMDLRAFLPAPITLAPGQREKIPTGICIETPAGFAALILARSGIAARCGIGLCNGVGLIDSDYRGELIVSLINHGQEPFVVADGDRIAQLMLTPAPMFRLVESALSDTARGDGGFGSTGV